MDRIDRAIAFSLSLKADPNRMFPTPEEKVALDRILWHEQKYPCPFCKGCPCPHWNGHAWLNPAYYPANAPAAPDAPHAGGKP